MEIFMAGTLWVSGRWWRAAGSARMVWNQKQDHGLRFVTVKASNRAAVHGVKRPINEKIDEEVEQEIKKGKEQKESKKKEIEKTGNSQ